MLARLHVRHFCRDHRKRQAMNKDTIAGNWKQLKGKIQENSGSDPIANPPLA